MNLRLLTALFFLNSVAIFSQERVIKHTIVKGETVSSIADKYQVKQREIIKLNPSAKKLLKLNAVLVIPQNAKSKNRSKSNLILSQNTKEHEVQAKETLYGIAKQYGIGFKLLKALNPTVGESELPIGQKINVPENAFLSSKTESDVANQTENGNRENQNVVKSTFTRAVLPKETKYSITRKYGITIKEFDKVNPGIGVKALRAGQMITIPGNEVVSQSQSTPLEENRTATVVASSKNENLETISNTSSVVEKAIDNSASLTQPKAPAATLNSQSIIREVLPKETKYAIAKQYGITVKELEKQNPEIKKGLPVGHKLSILSPTLSSLESNQAAEIKISDAAIESKKIDFNTSVKPSFNYDFLDQLIYRASENIGTRYRSGGTSKEGFDCSGLMCSTFGSFDIKLPRTSREQSAVGTKISTDEAQKGDLIFFKTNGRGRINHVGMVVEVCEGEIKFIHSSTSNGVIISSTKEKYYEKNFSQINRVVQ
ncbi:MULTISPECIES: peptidoglycan endopeptidase [unclassified Flavobacterium]|uniref:peptidoglycan endopeptidase n=1 Tax=unclassified Flavobacterium TaxID=196869 RepID=UPI00131ABA66|nr:MULTISPECIES: peptidoglycan endopeptidase [unclassified Flavobacterium]